MKVKNTATAIATLSLAAGLTACGSSSQQAVAPAQHTSGESHSIALSDWQAGPALPQALSGNALISFDRTIWSMGGDTWAQGKKQWIDKVWSLKLKTTATPRRFQWSSYTALPIALSYPAVTSDGSYCYLVGGVTIGEKATNKVWRVDENGQVTPMPSLPEPRGFAMASVIGNKLLVLGGAPDIHHLQTAVAGGFVLDLDNPSSGWKMLPDMPCDPRVLSAAAAMDGRLYIFGGLKIHDGQYINTASSYSYDPSTRRWDKLPPLPESLRAAGVSRYKNRWIIVAGGYAGNRNTAHYSKQVIAFDTVNQTYQPLKPLPQALMPRAVVCNNKLIVAGGEDKAHHRTNNVWISKIHLTQ